MAKGSCREASDLFGLNKTQPFPSPQNRLEIDSASIGFCRAISRAGEIELRRFVLVMCPHTPAILECSIGMLDRETMALVLARILKRFKGGRA